MPVRLADVRPPRPSGGAVRRRQVEWRHLEFKPKNEMRILSRVSWASATAPPCIRQRRFRFTAGDWHGFPLRVRARQRGVRFISNGLWNVLSPSNGAVAKTQEGDSLKGTSLYHPEPAGG